MSLQETAVEKVFLDGGGHTLLYQARHQHWMNGPCLIGKPVDEETWQIDVDNNAVVPQSEIKGKVAIGIAPDGSYQEAPDQTPWSERF